MPNRILREGILSSRRVNRLKPQAELFYRRLMSVVDDYGRFSADLSLLRASCYPLRLDEVREADISRWLAEVQTAGLIALYAVKQEPYLELLDFRQQRRALKSKCPPPPEDAQQTSSACVAGAQHMHPEAEAESKTETKSEAQSGEHEGGLRPPAPPVRAAGKASRPEGRSGRPPGRAFTPPTEDEWVAYAAKTWPDWGEHDVRSAWGSYQGKGWKGKSDWQACAKTCYHWQAGAQRSQRPGRPATLFGAHPPSKSPERDVDDDSPEWVQEADRRLRTRDPLSDEAASALVAWRRGEDPPEPDLRPEEERGVA